jgi:hypothetical protein
LGKQDIVNATFQPIGKAGAPLATQTAWRNRPHQSPFAILQIGSWRERSSRPFPQS